MIDTLKLGIPLTSFQFRKIRKHVDQSDRWQWIQFQPNTGERRFVRMKGLVNLDRQSFHRDTAFDVSEHYTPDATFLILELSLPKFWYGHNIHLLYNFIDPLKELKRLLENQFQCRFADVLDWNIFRLDICYAWKTPSQTISQKILDSLKRLHYPRKKPIIYPSSIVFAGTTYSFKFYLKYPEFIQNDKKALKKAKASLEWITHLENLSSGVIRCEATLRRKYLKKQNLNIIRDLFNSRKAIIDFSEEFIQLNPSIQDNQEYLRDSVTWILLYQLLERGKDISTLFSHKADFLKNLIENFSPYIEEDKFYNAPPKKINFAEREFIFNGGSFRFKVKDNFIEILEYFVGKFIGENKGMDTAEQVQEKLLIKYKAVKAARLTSMWLYIQKFGTQKAKNFFGHNSYYVGKRDLKLAGVSLVEPPKVINASERFLESFSFDIPSPYVTNAVDDFRDSGNLLNLPQQSVAE